MADGTLERLAGVARVKARALPARVGRRVSGRTSDIWPMREGRRGSGSRVKSEGERNLMRSSLTYTTGMSMAEGTSGRRVDIRSEAEGVGA